MPKKEHNNQRPVRMLTRDGYLNVEKDSSKSFKAYDHLIEISWQRFLLYAFIIYVLINIIFSFFYLLGGGISCLKNTPDYPSVWREFLDIFFFSTQTFTTVGYGHVHPNCLISNIIASFESFLGLVFFSVVTGLFYTKFTKPRVEISLSDVAVIERFREGFGLKFIVANKFENKLVDLEVTVDLIKLEMAEGRLKKRFYQLFLFRKRIPYLSVPWTVVHIIDEKSPLHGMSEKSFSEEHLEFFVQIKAFDETHREFIYKEFSYFGTDEVLWGHKFVNIQNYTQTGALKISMRRFGKTTKLSGFPKNLVSE
jgi:inward rectifier potassium channel